MNTETERSGSMGKVKTSHYPKKGKLNIVSLHFL